MKKLLVLSLAAIFATTIATAQTERTTEAKPTQERHNRKGDKMKMAKELNLSKEQMAQMKENHKAMKAKHDALKANDQITVKEMKERKAALKAEQDANMDKVLTAEQKTKFAEIKKERKGNNGKHLGQKKEHHENEGNDDKDDNRKVKDNKEYKKGLKSAPKPTASDVPVMP
jgi:periplasmic protein CpxP/Spy